MDSELLKSQNRAQYTSGNFHEEWALKKDAKNVKLVVDSKKGAWVEYELPDGSKCKQGWYITDEEMKRGRHD